MIQKVFGFPMRVKKWNSLMCCVVILSECRDLAYYYVSSHYIYGRIQTPTILPLYIIL